MTDRTDFIQACKKELERLKKEEAFIRGLLRDVHKQLGKYKIEALHMSHVNLTEDTKDDEKLDDDISNDNLIIDENIDVAEIINKNKLNLEITDGSGGEEFEESEESELSD